MRIEELRGVLLSRSRVGLGELLLQLVAGAVVLLVAPGVVDDDI